MAIGSGMEYRYACLLFLVFCELNIDPQCLKE
jgi:hypothetical protein